MADGNPLVLGESNQANNPTELAQDPGGWNALYVSGDSGLVTQSWSKTFGWGVYATASGSSGTAVYAYSPNIAGSFWGDVEVIGNFTVYYSQKSAAVRHPDGSTRLLYSMESPECWFEDFGRSKLTRGKAQVKIDRDFLALVRTVNYYIFLTPEGESNGLYVSRKDKVSFEVRELQNGKSNARFSYRIVAKRKDVIGRRLARVKPPKRPSLPKPPRRKKSR